MSAFRDRQARRRGNSTAYWLGLPAFFDRLWDWRARRSSHNTGAKPDERLATD